MELLKDLLPDFLVSSYKASPLITSILIFAAWNILASVTWLGVRHAAQETKAGTPQTKVQVNTNAPVTTGNCSAAAIGQASGVSIRCDDKAAASSEHKESGQKK